MFDAALQSFGALHAQFGPMLDTWLLIFVRILAFVTRGPIFNRKNIPIMVKLCITIYLTMALIWLVPVESHGSLSQGQAGVFFFQIVMNILIGALLGFIADLILQAIYSAGNMMNNQIGLSSAMIMDPSSGRQTMVLEPLFGMLGILVFIHLGGVHWMILALERSFTLFPLYAVEQPVLQVVNLEYLIHLSSNVLLVGVSLVAPVIVVTMSIDIMLGVVNRAAQQMPVFQLSFALKPSIGVAVLLLTLPILLQTMMNFLNDYAHIF